MIVKNYADQEKYNLTTKKALEEFSQALISDANQQDLQVKRIEEFVVGEICNYEQFCKNSREEVKETGELFLKLNYLGFYNFQIILVFLRDKKLSSRKQLDHLRQKKMKKHKNVSVQFKIIT